MKILHVITTINRGGAENHLRDLIHGQIIHQGLEVACAYLKGDGYWSESLREMGCCVYALEMKHYGQLRPAILLRQLIKRFKPDIVHTHLAPSELYSRIALLGNRATALVSTRHSHSRFYKGFGSDIVESWVVSRINSMIGISESVRNFFAQKYPVLSDRFDVVLYGINPSSIEKVSEYQRQSLRGEWGVNDDAVLLGTVARLDPVKDLKTLLDGYARLRAGGLTIPIKLVIVGSGPLETELKRYAADIALEDSVIFAGFRQDIPVVMNALDVFVLTSISEGFGIVLLEDM